ncbi:MAG: hypothetical protein WC180_06745 [Candidatus Paceibacterota bacterium]
MPLFTGLATHDDTKHVGSAKRDIAGGVAGLDSFGNLSIPGGLLNLDNIGGGVTGIVISSDTYAALRLSRLSVKNYVGYIAQYGAYSIIQTERMKNIASGIAGLDLNALLSINQLPVGVINSYAISNNILDSNDPEQSTISVTGVLFGSFTFTSLKPSPSTVRFTYKLRTDDAAKTVYAYIIKNGIGEAYDYVDSDTVYHTFTHDITIEEGDVITLEYETTAGATAYAKEFRILGDITTFDPALGWNIATA